MSPPLNDPGAGLFDIQGCKNVAHVLFAEDSEIEGKLAMSSFELRALWSKRKRDGRVKKRALPLCHHINDVIVDLS